MELSEKNDMKRLWSMYLHSLTKHQNPLTKHKITEKDGKTRHIGKGFGYETTDHYEELTLGELLD